MNVLITAGPTREPIDPIRFISNRSSGKMGVCLAEAFAIKGAEVKLITGPTSFQNVAEVFRPPSGSLKASTTVISIETAEQMRQAVLANFEWADVIIMAAAVADYRPVEVAKQKIKKTADIMELRLEKTPDILAELGRKKRLNQKLVGFALETENLLENAKKKLVEKNLDLIIANSQDAIDTNMTNFMVIDRQSTQILEKTSKKQLASLLVKILCN